MTDYSCYVRTSLTSFLSVHSIVSVLHQNLNGRICSGEAHDFPELLYVNSGHHTLLVDGILHTMQPGQLIFYAPHSFHEGYAPSNATVSIISFEAAIPQIFSFYNRVITLTGRQQNILSQIISQGLDAFRYAPGELELQGMIPQAGIADYTLQQLKNQLELFLIELYKTAEPRQPRAVAANQENFRTEQLAHVK